MTIGKQGAGGCCHKFNPPRSSIIRSNPTAKNKSASLYEQAKDAAEQVKVDYDVLPAVADGERLFTGLLAAAEVVLGVGVLSGMATQYLMSGRLLVLDHKTLFSLLAFVVIGLLLWLNWSTGLRGRRATRFVLAAYLLLTLAYPGVKFVKDVLLS
jgi:ABC-type uncharacterized transport system permease subunit